MCDNADCDRDASWRAFIVAKNKEGEQLVEGDTHQVICNDCKDIITVESFMDEGQYAELCKTFTVRKLDPPSRSSMTIELRAI